MHKPLEAVMCKRSANGRLPRAARKCLSNTNAAPRGSASASDNSCGWNWRIFHSFPHIGSLEMHAREGGRGRQGCQQQLEDFHCPGLRIRARPPLHVWWCTVHLGILSRAAYLLTESQWHEQKRVFINAMQKKAGWIGPGLSSCSSGYARQLLCQKCWEKCFISSQGMPFHTQQESALAARCCSRERLWRWCLRYGWYALDTWLCIPDSEGFAERRKKISG